MTQHSRDTPHDVNAKVEEKPIVQYETLEERRAAMIAKGWAPSAVAALEEAMEPKFLRDMRAAEEERMKVVEGVEQADENTVPVLDAEGNPTGQTELKYGEGGELGYIKWLAEHHPGPYAMLYGKLIPLDVNAKVEEKPIVHYETLEERRAAMIAKGWAPSAVAALEEAMEPKFLRDMREENEGQGEAMIAAAPDMLKALRTIEFDVRGRCTACFGWDGSSENDHKHANDCIVASAIAKATGT